MHLPNFLLPNPPEAVARVPESAPADVPCVLLVDDEPVIRSLFARSLRDQGCHVLEAGDGAEAIETVAAVDRVDLVVTDIRMPKVDGILLAKLLRGAHPEIRIVFVTGYAVDDRETLGPNSILLNKPFLRSDLIAAVRRLSDLPIGGAVETETA
jgi:two-component system cell cycle sensor histidine kinase/response regulator CckA